VDALPTPGGGIEKVKEGRLTASAIYPTHGDDLITLAINILRGNNYDKTNAMETSLVTSDNANVLLLQYKEMVKQDEYIKEMNNRVDSILSELGTERTLLWCIIVFTLILATSLAVTIRTLHTKRKLNETLKLRNEELNREKGIAEQQRDELEEQRDKLLDATTQPQTEENDEEMSMPQQNEFIERFNRCIEERLSDSSLSVEDIGQELGLSRVQLYRKVKAMTGKTPVEIIREERLKRAKILIEDASISVSEIAYRVGFSSPSYFTKCYKSFYGKAPSAKKEG
jgi:AraC-like DNA-binding protein